MKNSSILQDNRFKVFFAVFVMIGWSLAYPLIKLGYQEFQIESTDLGGKILFAGVRFFCAGTAVTLYCHFKKIRSNISDSGDIAWLVLLGIVNTALHYMFAYIGLGYNSSARSTILDSMGGFILLCLITISAVCFAIYNALLSCHPISQIAIYNALIPVLGVIFAALLLYEELKVQYIIAVILVAIGIHVVNSR